MNPPRPEDPARPDEQFKAWLQEHRGILAKVAGAFTSSADERDDLIQEMLIRLWESMPSFRGECRVATWIYQVALNRALTWRRAESRRRQRLVPLVDAPDHRNPSDPNAERLQRMYAELRRLDEVDRSLLLMSLDGCSYREMATVMGMTESHVGARLTRARRTLSERIQDHADER